jgi:hyperosmotically inducible periplasmic protein
MHLTTPEHWLRSGILAPAKLYCGGGAMKKNLNKTVSTVLVLLGLVAVAPLGVWAGTGDQSAGKSGASQVWVPGQEHIQKSVLHQLRMLPYYSIFDNISFRVEGSQVELMGQVARPTLKSDAEGVVKHVEGVTRVVNNIEVLPVSNFDDRIRLAEARAIYRQAGFGRYAIQPTPPIHIIVKNGNVTLVGVVSNTMDKNVAGIQANGVFGVFSVTNDLRVER